MGEANICSMTIGSPPASGNPESPLRRRSMTIEFLHPTLESPRCSLALPSWEPKYRRRPTSDLLQIRTTEFTNPTRDRAMPTAMAACQSHTIMPMIDVYATEGTFTDKHTLAQNLAQAVMRWEQVPEIPLFSDNTAAFIHDLPADAIANAAGASDYVRVQVLTPVGFSTATSSSALSRS